MINSVERVSYIVDYISSYELKIKTANKNGLFDSAKLFELFALEICKLWFEQDFHNLNDKIMNCPYVDLVSQDEKIFVQVSTAKDIPTKIKTTLEKIRDNKSKKLSTIKSAYFFVLNNESIEKIKNYCDDKRIGDIDFNKKDHLITTQDIINRAMEDIDFQISLYNLLVKENNDLKETSSKLASEIEFSKTVGLNNIESLINNEYEIDRTKIIEEIKGSPNQFISVRGEAGSGKSVICKKVVEECTNLLYARAERFTEETDINDIWHLNVEYALKYLNDKSVIFFIDSLEFIADAPKTKLDLLQNLYELVKKHPNAKIITSCRSSDETAFIKIDSKYSIKSFLVNNLTVTELNKIAEKYPIIKTFIKDSSYIDLIKSPFYINLLVKNVTDYTSITDENKLRDFIWENVICLKTKAAHYKIVFSDIVAEIKRIAFDRAIYFSVGIDSENINSTILHALISEGIVIKNGNTIRLKYDIFEDICFEKEFDKQFDKCKGNYNEFFTNIEKYGRCCYRRYQIWISNKILTKNNRDKFLYNLVFSKNMPKEWVKQTEIGLVKSRFCTPFFEEQADKIINEGIIKEFIDITNLYAFEPQILFPKEVPIIFLSPKGNGRSSLIKIIYDNNLYKGSMVDSRIIIKICSDYAKNENYKYEIANMACTILEYYIEISLNFDEHHYYNIDKEINPLLNPIYQMSEVSKNWIISFWETLIADFLGKSHQKSRLAEKIIEYTLKCTTVNLAKNLPRELCDLAETFWTADLNRNHLFYINRHDSLCYYYGLNEHAESYEHSRDPIMEYRFFPNIIEQNLQIGLDWAINFINKSVSNYAEQKDVDIKEISLMFVLQNNVQKYYANCGMWLAGSQEYSVPRLLGDIVYNLKNKIINIIKCAISLKGDYSSFANNIKNRILKNSNNIMLFSIIEDIGIQFEEELPGFALDLATSMDIIIWDINRYVVLNPTKESQKMEENIFTVIGVPFLKGRYEEKAKMDYKLQDYVTKMQFYNETQEHCYKLLDFLYSIFPNDKANAHENLQIQKMDLRNQKIERIDENTVAITSEITGEAKKIVESNTKQNTSRIKINRILEEFFERTDPNNYELENIIKSIDKFSSEIKYVDTPFVYHEYFVIMLACALNKQELDSVRRSEYCNIWIDGVESIFANNSFRFEHNNLFVLFRQVNSNIDDETKRRIKSLILNVVTYSGDNGIILQLKKVTQEYLKTNTSLGKYVFYTIIMLSKDEMDHQLFNYNYIKGIETNDEIEFISNLTPKLKGIDYRLSQEGKQSYVSKREEIICKYLYDEDNADLSTFSIEECDINTLCNIVNCGLALNEDYYKKILHELIKGMLKTWNLSKDRYSCLELIEMHYSMEVSDFLGKELFENLDHVMDILFSGIDFTKFTDESIEFYQRIFDIILPVYVDAYKDSKRRHQCEKILLELEEKVKKIDCSDNLKKGLYRSLILSISGYEGDWSKVNTEYSFSDIQFLNNMFCKYGKYNFSYFMHTINKMKLNKLLPGILPSVNVTLREFCYNHFRISELDETKYILNNLIVFSFLNFNDEIKQDDEITKAYEGILETLISLNFEEAAVLLDEFRIH